MAVSVVAGLASAGSAYVVSTAATFTLSMALQAFALGAGLSAVSRALMPSPDLDMSLGGLSTTIKDPASARPIIYGRAKTGGTLAYIGETGTDSKYLHMVIALAGHEIDSYEKIYANDEVLWDGTSVVSKYANNAQIKFYTGNQTSADADLVNAVTEWDSTCILQGVAYIYVRLEYDAEVFKDGIPNITALIRGKKIYDPRTSTTAWSDNPALCINDYMKDSKYGLGSVQIDEQSVIDSANLSDQQVDLSGSGSQKRYTLDGVCDTASKISTNIESMTSAMAGRVVFSSGKFYIYGGAYQAPILDVNESHFTGEITLQTKQSRRTAYNAVKGVFLSSENDYVLSDYPAQISSTYALEDGEPLYLDMTLPFTTNNVRAQRLAKLALLKSRQQRLLTLPLNLSALKLRAGDTLRVTSSKLGLSNALYEVVDFEMGNGLTVNVLATETSPELYDWTTSDQVDFHEASDVSLWDGSALPPTGLTATAITEILTDGAASTHIDVAWTNPDDVYFDYIVLKWGSESIITKDQEFTINNVDQDSSYTINISAYNKLGNQSTGLSASINTTVDVTAPANVTSPSISSGLQSITLNWTNPSDNDFDLVRIKVSTTTTQPSEHSFEVRSDSFTHDIGAYSATRHYWLAPVDRTGNVGSYVSGGSATTGSIAIGDVPAVAGTFYLTLGDNNAPTDVEFNNAVGRNPINGDVAIVNKEYFFTRGASAWTAVTEFIDGSLLVSDSVTATEINVTKLSSLSSDLGDITAGSIDINSGALTIDEDGNLVGTSVTVSGDITASTLTLTGAQVQDSRSSPSLILSSSQLDQSVINLIDTRIEGYGLASSGDFAEDTGGFNNTIPDHPVLENFTHLNGKNVAIELTASSTWSGTGTTTLPPQPDNPALVIEIQRRISTETNWDNAVIVDTITNGTSPSTVITGGNWVYGYSTNWFNGLTINYEFNDDPATGTYDYRAFIKTIGDNYTGVSTFYFEANEAGTASGGGVNDYVDSFSINDSTGLITVGRTGTLGDLTASISTYVGNQVSALVDSAPATLDTLNELASALGDDANFAQTTATALGTKTGRDSDETITGDWTFSGSVGGVTRVASLPTYTFVHSDTPDSWEDGLSVNFVGAGDSTGYPNYGSVMRVKTYDNDGGNGEIYFPYSSTYGGDQLQYRVGKYNNAGMTSFRKIWDDNQFSSTDISNWDTAYGWGNHASAGYLTSFDITTQTDAKYLRSDVADTTSSRIDFRAGITSQTLDIGYTGDRTIQALSNDLTFGTYGDLHLQHYGGDLHMVHGGGIMYDNGNRVFSNRYHPNADKWTEAITITLGDDLSGSVSLDGSSNVTLNANININSTDTFGGTYPIAWLASDNLYKCTWMTVDGANDRLNVPNVNATSSYLLNGTTVIDSSRNLVSINAITATGSGMGLFSTDMSSNDDWQNSPISIRERGMVSSAQSADTYAPNLNFHWAGRTSNSLWMNSSGHLVYGSYNSNGTPNADGTFASGAVRTNIIYDLGDVSTYLEMRGDGGGLRSQTSNGYIDFGAMNTAYAHIQTDRSKFYFNKRITVDEGIVQSYNEDLILRRASSSSHQMTLNTSGATFTGNVTAYSDITLKDNISEIDNALEKVNSIRGVTYDRIDQDNERQTGVIAQEVEKVLPEVVHTNDNGIKSVAYGNMVGLLIEAIKELKAEIEELKK